MEINIIKETQEYILLWKEQGLPITPTKENPTSLISELIAQRPDLSNVEGYKKGEFGLLNRLDNETGGIVIVAKTNDAFNKYKNLMKKDKIKKIYLAYCSNNGKEKKGKINLPIAHHKKNKTKMVTVNNKNKNYRGKPQISETKFELINELKAKKIWKTYLEDKIKFPNINSKKIQKENCVWILCQITKGKRHQIRLHLASIGYPILFDKLYSTKQNYTQDYHKLFSIGVEIIQPPSKTQ